MVICAAVVEKSCSGTWVLVKRVTANFAANGNNSIKFYFYAWRERLIPWVTGWRLTEGAVLIVSCRGFVT
jgi:hypothetical protein